jgi:hypothetical protein
LGARFLFDFAFRAVATASFEPLQQRSITRMSPDHLPFPNAYEFGEQCNYPA